MPSWGDWAGLRQPAWQIDVKPKEYDMERAMRKIVSILSAIAFFVFATSPSFGTVYRTGNLGCGDFEDTERQYKEQLNDPDPYVSLTLVYALCLLAKGEVTNNQDDVSRGMLILHGLADQHSNIVANYWIAEYHLSGGDFKGIADRNLDLAAKYYSRTLAIIKTYNKYPPLEYFMWEATDNIEMNSLLSITSCLFSHVL